MTSLFSVSQEPDVVEEENKPRAKAYYYIRCCPSIGRRPVRRSTRHHPQKHIARYKSLEFKIPNPFFRSKRIDSVGKEMVKRC